MSHLWHRWNSTCCTDALRHKQHHGWHLPLGTVKKHLRLDPKNSPPLYFLDSLWDCFLPRPVLSCFPMIFSYDMLHHCLQVSMSKLIVFFHPVPCLLEDYRRIGNMNDEHFEMTKMDSSDFRSISTFWSSLFLITVPLGPCFFPLGSCNCSPSHWSTDLPRLFKKGCFQNEKVKKDKEKTKVTVFKAVSLFFAPWCVKCRCLDVLHARMPLESVLHMVRPRPRLLGEAPLQRETGKRQTKCVCFC